MLDDISLLIAVRKNFNGILKIHSLEEINRIPKPFANNLIWNVGHAIVTQQLLMYKLSDLPMNLPDGLLDQYRKGSKPEGPVDEEHVKMLLDLSKANIAKLQEDMEKGVFKKFNTYTTSYGITLNSFDEALRFNNAHENLHLGYMMAIRKLLA